MVVITDPGIAISSDDDYTTYEEGMRQDIYIKGMDGAPFIGKEDP